MNEMKSSGAMTGRTVQASIWLLSGVIYGRAANLLMTIILARILAPRDFGLVALGTTLLVILSAITDLALSNALVHHQDATKDDYDTAFTLGVLRGILLAAIMLAGGFVMAEVYKDSRLVWIGVGLASRPLLSGIASPYYVKYVKDLKFGTVAITEALNYTAQLVISVGVALLTHSYWAIVAGLVAASFVGLTSTFRVAPYRPHFTLKSWRKIMHFSIWVTLTQTITMIGNRFDNFLAGGMLGISTFGAYNVGNNVSAMITQSAIIPLERVLFPSFAKITHDKERLKAAFQKAQASLFAIGLPLGVGLALVAEPFVYLTLGPKWGVAVTVIEYVAPVLGVQVVFGPSSALAFALGATRTLFMRSLVMLALRGPIVLFGLYFYGLEGLLIARTISGGVLVSVVNAYMVRSMIGVSPWEQVKVTWRSIVACLAMIGAVLAMKSVLPNVTNVETAAISLAALVPTGALVYGGMHVALWLASGRPSRAIETEIANYIGKISARLSGGRRQPAE